MGLFVTRKAAVYRLTKNIALSKRGIIMSLQTGRFVKNAALILATSLLFACTGDDGPPGPQGETGAQGPQGEQGDQGAAGANGAVPASRVASSSMPGAG